MEWCDCFLRQYGIHPAAAEGPNYTKSRPEIENDENIGTGKFLLEQIGRPVFGNSLPSGHEAKSFGQRKQYPLSRNGRKDCDLGNKFLPYRTNIIKNQALR